MRRVIKLFFLSIAVLISGCSYFKEPKNPPAALVEFKEVMAIKKAWSANVGESGNFIFNPVYVENTVLTAATNGNIFRFDNSTGSQIWKTDAGMILTAGVGADNTSLAVVGDKGVVLVYDLNGKLRWKVQASSEILSSPVIGDGLVVVRSIDNHIVAYDALPFHFPGWLV